MSAFSLRRASFVAVSSELASVEGSVVVEEEVGSRFGSDSMASIRSLSVSISAVWRAMCW